MARKLPPGPRQVPVHSILRFSRDPLGFITEISQRYGPVTTFIIGRQRIFLVTDPELVKEVLVLKHRSFRKDRGIQLAKRMIGEGLLSSEGDFHKRQRRLVQPGFHKERIAAYGAEIVRYAAHSQERWRDGAFIEAVGEMNKLTLGIVARTLFGTDVEAEAEELGRALTDALEVFSIFRLGFSAVLDRLPLQSTKRWKAASERLDRTMYRMIEERRHSNTDAGDLMSMLLLATDIEGDGSGMSNQQLRDEAMTIFLAGHETTANALAWTWYLLAQNPEVEAKLHAELDTQLAGRTPTLEDMRRLPYTEHVVAESMRLFPPAWGIGRTATETVEIGGYEIRAGEDCLVSQWVVHRDAKYYPDPGRFDPDRWEPALAASRPKFSYFPFGAGPRICIGESFAWMEAILVLATLAQDWRLRLVPNQKIYPKPRITLRPTPAIRMSLERRNKASARASA